MKSLKSIWKRRGRYGWLILEIVVASAIAFYVLDPIVVSIYDSSRNFNYDDDRLVMVQTCRLDYKDPAFDEERANSEENIETDMMQIVMQLAQLSEAEKVIPLPTRGFGGGEDSGDKVDLPDSIIVNAFKATFIPGTEFFTTMGFKAASDIPGNPNIEQMNDMHVDFSTEMICTRMEARLLYGDEFTAMEKSRQAREENVCKSRYLGHLKIVGIIEDTRA